MLWSSKHHGLTACSVLGDSHCSQHQSRPEAYWAHTVLGSTLGFWLGRSGVAPVNFTIYQAPGSHQSCWSSSQPSGEALRLCFPNTVGVLLPEILILGRGLWRCVIKNPGELSWWQGWHCDNSERKEVASSLHSIGWIGFHLGKNYSIPPSHYPKTTTSRLKIFVFENKTYTRKCFRNFVVEKAAEEMKSTPKGCS